MIREAQVSRCPRCFLATCSDVFMFQATRTWRGGRIRKKKFRGYVFYFSRSIARSQLSPRSLRHCVQQQGFTPHKMKHCPHHFIIDIFEVNSSGLAMSFPRAKAFRSCLPLRAHCVLARCGAQGTCSTITEGFEASHVHIGDHFLYGGYDGPSSHT